MHRVFAIAPYEPDENGMLRVVLPSRCAFAPPWDECCSVRVDHERQRKTGPRLSLAVVICRRHSPIRYTLYPPGHAPYRRAKIAPVGLDGLPLRDGVSLKVEWDGTVAAGVPYRVRRSRLRHRDEAARLAGVHQELSQHQRELIAARLCVPTLSLITLAAQWWRQPGLRDQGVAEAVAAIPTWGNLLDRVLAAGAVAALWPEACRWNPRSGGWIRPFQAKRTRASDGGWRRPRKTTTSSDRPRGQPARRRTPPEIGVGGVPPPPAGTPGGP